MKKKEVWKTVSFVIICILINYIGKFEAENLNFPMWFDSIGTGLSAYILGPACGALIGAAGNIIYGINNTFSCVYTLTGTAIGITMGICMKKGLMESFFGAFTSSMIVAVMSTVISTPLNCIFFDGFNGNLWGNGVFEMFRYYGIPLFISSAVGEFCVDFLDKSVTVLLIYWLIKQKRFYKKRREKSIVRLFLWIIPLAAIMTQGLSPIFEKTIYAAESDNFYSGYYIPTVYGISEGLPGGTANDISETNDGFLWIGTNNGLYRYDGINFNYMNEFSSVKNVNCLFVDEESRLWIGTDDNGLSICVNDSISNVIDSENGLSKDSVKCIGADSNGRYYVGTSDNLHILSLDGGLKIIKDIPDIKLSESISSSENGYTSVVTNNGKIFILKDLTICHEMSLNDLYERYTCCTFGEDGLLYVGTNNNNIYCFDITNKTIRQINKIETGVLKNIKSMTICDDENNWICSDTGIGFLDNKNNFHYVNTDNFNSIINNMTMDYQGNLWFTSSKSGLLKLCVSNFTDIYKQAGLTSNSVNAVTKWQDKLYFGTDNGLDIINISDSKVSKNKLSEYMRNKKIKFLKTDLKNHLWLCFFEGNEIVEAYPDGQIFTHNISGGKFYCLYELKDGTMTISCESGLFFIKDGKVVNNISIKDISGNCEILSVFEKADGTLLAGTNGNGIIVIKNGKVIEKINKKSGLASDVILKMVSDENGVFIITGSSLCYMDNSYKVKVFNKFPYYDNYDILFGENNTLWILGGAGIYIADKSSLFFDKESDYHLLNSKMGFNNPLSENAQNFMDENGDLYMPCGTGCYFVNINKYDKTKHSCRINMKYINVDNNKYYVNKSETTNIDRNAKVIEIVPILLNYSLNNHYIRYCLEGFDSEPIVVSQSEINNIVYTNLPSGDYTFRLEVLDNSKSNVISAASYKIRKEKLIFENWWFIAYFILICILVVVWFSWFLTRLRLNKTIKEEQHKLAIAKRQTEMGNETIIAIAKTVDAKDSNTRRHSERVAEYSVMLAKKLGWNEQRQENLRKTALLHDIGKIGIPDSVLNKPSRLTDEEYSLMKSHVKIGAEILKDFTIVEDVADGARYHHERYDGKGYINGLKGEEIPINARIIGIADAFDAMTSNRVYRKHLDINYVIEELKKGCGTQFDPEISKIMIELIENGNINIAKLYDDEPEKAE